MKKLLLLSILPMLYFSPGYGQKEHSIEFSIGAFPLTENMEVFDGWWGCCDDIYFPRPGLSDFYADRNYLYYGKMTTYGAFTLKYAYVTARHWEMSAQFTYTGFYQDLHDLRTGVRVGKDNAHYFTFTPHFNYMWLRRNPAIKLYSGAGLGFSFMGGSESNGQLTVMPSFTFIGARLGRGAVYGTAEFGAGPRGLFMAGIGYKIGNKKK